MKSFKKCFLIAGLIATICFGFVADTLHAQVQTADYEPDSVVYCHRCGMRIIDKDNAIRIEDVPGAPWYQCCPVCALKDIYESSDKTGTIYAFCDTTGDEIEIEIRNGKVINVDPEETVILIGGMCMLNKTFVDREAYEEYIEDNPELNAKPVKTVKDALAFVGNSTAQIGRCSMCSTELKGHEKQWVVLMLKNKERHIGCCAHCGLFMMYKMKDQVKNAMTMDWNTGESISAKDAWYVVDADLVTCCVPATYSFKNKADAEIFQGEHGGELMTYTETMNNIQVLLKTPDQR